VSGEIARPVSTPPPPPAPPRTRYAMNGNISLAYHVLGDGPTDLLVVLGGVSHLELAYGHPSMGGFLSQLARRHRVILFDKRGAGMSDRVSDATTPWQRLEDMRVVMDAAGSKRAVLLGIGEGAAVTALFAAVHPSLTLAAVLWGGSARVLSTPDHPHGASADFVETSTARIRELWGEAVFADLEAPSLAADEAFREWTASYLRMAASPGNALALLRENVALDVRRIVGDVSVPTVVLHRRGDRVTPIGAGRWLSSHIPGARFYELEGDDHVPFAGDARRVVSLVEDVSRQLLSEDASGERSVLAPVGVMAALAGLADPKLASPKGRLVGADPLGAVFAFDDLGDALALARHALDRGITRSVGLHVAPCPARSPSLVAPGVLEARAVAESAPPGGIGGSAIVFDLGYGLDLRDVAFV